MTRYRVIKDDEVVWEHTTDEYEGTQVFPAEYRDRPTSGVVVLAVDDEIVGVQRPLSVELAEQAAAAAEAEAAAEARAAGDEED